jgi:hypothetical protein
MKHVPICPECREEFTRLEWVEELGGRTGFCHPCAKHFELCHSNLHMSSCVRGYKHYGHHIDGDGREFVDDNNGARRVAPTPNRTVFDYKVIVEFVPFHQLTTEQPTPFSDGRLNWTVSETIGEAVIFGHRMSKEFLDELNEKTRIR